MCIYGVIHAVQGISFNIEAGEIVALLGANGGRKNQYIVCHLEYYSHSFRKC